MPPVRKADQILTKSAWAPGVSHGNRAFNQLGPRIVDFSKGAKPSMKVVKLMKVRIYYLIKFRLSSFFLF